MSTLGNYMFQSFNFRSKCKLRPFYSLVASHHRRGAWPRRAGQQRRRHARTTARTATATKTDGGDISDAPFEA